MPSTAWCGPEEHQSWACGVPTHLCPLCPVSMAGVQWVQQQPDRLCPQALIISRRERNKRRKNTREVCLVQPAGAGDGSRPNFQGLLRGPWVFLASLPSRLLELVTLSEGVPFLATKSLPDTGFLAGCKDACCFVALGTPGPGRMSGCFGPTCFPAAPQPWPQRTAFSSSGGWAVSRCLGQVALQGDQASERLHLRGEGGVGQHWGTEDQLPAGGQSWLSL